MDNPLNIKVELTFSVTVEARRLISPLVMCCALKSRSTEIKLSQLVRLALQFFVVADMRRHSEMCILTVLLIPPAISSSLHNSPRSLQFRITEGAISECRRPEVPA